MSKPFRFGVAAHAVDGADTWRALARRVESQGYATLLLPDHTNPQLSPIPALVAAAAVTTAGVFGGLGSGIGAVGAAATIFFAYVGFDAVSTAAEETRDPQKNVPIGLIGSLLICTIFYILVAAGASGTASSAW